MAVYCEKQWWSGTDRDENRGELLNPQPPWDKPKYRPGQTVRYRTSNGKSHVGLIRYVFREKAESLDFYRIIRTKNGAAEITFDCQIEGKVE